MGYIANMYIVKSIMGDTVFQVIEEPGGHIIESFYTERVAKEFCDRLTERKYWDIMDRSLYEHQWERGKYIE